MELLSPCDPRFDCDKKVKYLKNKKETYEFKLKAKALGGSIGKSVLLSRPIKIEVCDPLDMTKVVNGEISKIFPLKSKSGVDKDI